MRRRNKTTAYKTTVDDGLGVEVHHKDGEGYLVKTTSQRGPWKRQEVAVRDPGEIPGTITTLLHGHGMRFDRALREGDRFTTPTDWPSYSRADARRTPYRNNPEALKRRVMK